MLEQEEIDKLVDGDGDEDKESYASAFVDSVINNDGDDIGSKLEPGSHKEHPEHVSDDDEMQRKDEEAEKEKDVIEIVKETNVDDISAKKNNEAVTKKEFVDMNDLPSDKTISKELADTATPTNDTSSKTPSTTTRQKKSFTLKTRHVPGIITTNEMLKKEMPHLVKLAANKDREVSSVDISGGETWRKYILKKEESFVNGRPILPMMKRLL
uniref:Uncharacterized protein n=1 Tax=Tanacetum cinerariifolium TaxID=118510 RepID=A0A6L2LPG5_TANCI|nr:hypothetical protein [Tanacetum cinerariifolium]